MLLARRNSPRNTARPRRPIIARSINKVDVVTVASPGVTHFEIASHLLRAGCDVLLEKPMAATVDDARALTALAESSDRILQIGHLERFNPVVNHLRSILNRPRFVECHRLAPFTERGTDVDVVLDLMVHDLDVLMSLTGAEATSVEALGVAVLTDQIDVANARIRFSNGMIANVNTSRVAARRERKIRFFQPDAYISVDYEARRIQIYRKSPPPPGRRFRLFRRSRSTSARPIRSPMRSRRSSPRCATRSVPAVTARDGLRVIELIERIRICMEQP